MVRLALDPAHRRLSVEEFLDMDFGDAKAELEDGIIYMMSGGSEVHARIAGNIFASLHASLRGSGCRPYGSDFATRTGEQSVRYPDVSVYCNNPGVPANAAKKLLGDPVMVVEVLSASTRSYDQRVKLDEYRALAGVKDILLVDPEDERVRHVHRTARGWTDEWLDLGADVELASLDCTLPHAEIFAHD